MLRLVIPERVKGDDGNRRAYLTTSSAGSIANINSFRVKGCCCC